VSQDEGESARRPWDEGPDEQAPSESWLLLDDDELLHRIETLSPDAAEDERLIEVVASNRHFFVRQEAAKRVQDRNRLFDFEDDRHVGQILVRHLTRREDLTYLERLSSHSRHVEVRSAAQVQLARLWRRLDGAGIASPPATAAGKTGAGAAPAKAGLAAASPKPKPAAEPITSAAIERGGVDGSLLAWAVHFLVQPTWSSVGTEQTREILTRTRRELIGSHPTLAAFEVTAEAHVTIHLETGPRLPSEAVRAVAAWMTAYRTATGPLAPDVAKTSVRAATAMVADALRDIGFYAACDELESGRP
jgi:hypothetical protein